MFESREDGGCVGHSDTYLRVLVPEQGLRGQLRDVRITAAAEEYLQGELV